MAFFYLQAKISKIRRSFTTAFTRLWIAGTMLSVTPAHALQTESGTWVAARQLEKGTQLRSITGVVRLDSTYTESVSPTPVISYELEGGLDYVVGEMPVVVAGICQLRSVVEAFDGNKVAFQNLIKGLNPLQRSALIQGISEIADLTKRKDFIKAFVADAKFAKGIGEDASLIKTWNEVGFLAVLKNDIVFLKALKKTKDNSSLLKHLIGEVKNNGTAGGCHFYQSILTNKARKSLNKPFAANHPTKTGGPNVTEYAFKGTPNEMERTWIDIKDANGNFVAKTSNHSSFFPTAWSEQKVIEEIALAYKNRVAVPNTQNTFRGTSSEGFDIEFFIKPDGTDDLITAFPSSNINFQP